MSRSVMLRIDFSHGKVIFWPHCQTSVSIADVIVYAGTYCNIYINFMYLCVSAVGFYVT
jgi:hypothetical protein